MNIHGITNTNFGAKIQFENRTAENTPLPAKCAEKPALTLKV